MVLGILCKTFLAIQRVLSEHFVQDSSHAQTCMVILTVSVHIFFVSEQTFTLFQVS
jgi:uncharacterized membrane protein YwzB